jgi:oxygen-independent coproporphyrinogen III oxidase
MELAALIRKYAGPGPRYTSYPTAPQWAEVIGPAEYAKTLAKPLPDDEPLGMYVHIPFCESLCYYCGCNIQITHDHSRSARYVEALKREIALVADLFGQKRKLGQISWGGGTPTFLTLSEIRSLYEGITKSFDVLDNAEVSIEIDPRVTTNEQLELLRALGFNRVSLGVQDFNPEVQRVINRVQPEAMTAGMLEKARSLGFRGINFDLIYGLPLQSVDTFRRTLEALVQIGPDRIALYNYARLPSLLKHQAILEKHPMPSPEERVEIFLLAYEALETAGYVAIGMDHFAKTDDELAKAVENGMLYRNFMGYTVRRGKNLLGIGASAIGEISGGFFQNTKKASDYEKALEETGLATARGMLLSDEDERRKWIIQSLMCQFRLFSKEFESEFGESLEARYPNELKALSPFIDDGILTPCPEGYLVTQTGRLFIRNVAMVFDAYLNVSEGKKFSQTV